MQVSALILFDSISPTLSARLLSFYEEAINQNTKEWETHVHAA